MSNPLLEPSPLPNFPAIEPAHIEPAIDTLLAENARQLAALLNTGEAPCWETLAEPVALMNNRLSRAWSPVGHLNGVMNSDALRSAYTACLPKLTAYYTQMSQNADLYEAYKAVAENSVELRAEQRKVLENVLRDFRLSGVDLPAAKKTRFAQISEELSSLESNFSDQVLDATNAWSKHFDAPDALAGLPDSAVAQARQTAEQRGLSGYVITLDAPSYLPVMTYALDAALREEVYRAFNTRASDQGPMAGDFDNSENMRRILALRHEQAQLLGYANYAALSLAKKMAPSTAEVMQFLEELAQRSRPQALQELADLRAFAAREYQQDTLEPWDMAFYSEKYREHCHNISEEEVKPYFPVDRVIGGMFKVVSRLFGVSFHRVNNAQLYHPDVSFYEIRDTDGALRAQFYFDLYARQRKRGGAWMDVCQSRLKARALQQIPVAYMVCNFTPPLGSQPSLLTHREVETLFHEFGHGLHHMLTRVDEYEISGIHGVAWDAVELPSQFMENFCWEREALDQFAAHVETGEKIPEDLYQRMLAAKNFQSGMGMLRQLEFSLFDFRMHLEYDPAAGDRCYEILQSVRDAIAVVDAPSWNRFPHSFSHVFAGGYAAGYYSYKWAEVLSADAFSLFEEQGIFDPVTGHAFLTHILERGGAGDAMDLFIAFRGREPHIDALLRHTGIAA